MAKINYNKITYEELLSIIISGCKFKYSSYDHKKALEDYKKSSVYDVVRKHIPNPNVWDMPEELKEKYKLERIGTLREIHFMNGKAWRFKIGSKFPKTFFINDFGLNVFPI